MPLRPSGPFGSDSMFIVQTFDCHFAFHRDFATEEKHTNQLTAVSTPEFTQLSIELRKSNSWMAKAEALDPRLPTRSDTG